MAQFGLQPNGMIRLDDGTMWNPQGNLPADPTAFNGTPMGNPLQPQTLPRMLAPATAMPSPASQGPAPTQAPIAAPQGMFANQGAMGISPNLPTNIDATAPVVPPKKPGFNDPGGWGGKLSDIGDILLAAGGNPAGPALIQAQSERRQNTFTVQKQALQQQAEFQRQLMLLQYKQTHPDPTDNARDAVNAGYAPGTPEYQQFIRNVKLPPVITTVNGQPMAYSREQLNGGIAASGAGSAAYPRVSDADSYNALKSGDHFLDPQGNVRVKP